MLDLIWDSYNPLKIFDFYTKIRSNEKKEEDMNCRIVPFKTKIRTNQQENLFKM